MTSLLIKNAEIWNANQIEKNQDILIEDGKISKIQAEIEADGDIEVLDAAGKVLIPAGIDCQVHLRVPGQEHKEHAHTALKAALRGGYMGVVAMPNTSPTLDCPEVIKQAQELIAPAEKEFGVKAWLTGAMTLGLEEKVISNAADLKKAGVAALTDDGVGIDSDEMMEKIFAQAAEADIPLMQHCEVSGHGGVLAPGKTQRELGIPPYFAEPEWKMVERDLGLLAKYPSARYHVLHMSCKESVDLVKEAKAKGLNATGEVTPHHLFFHSDMIPEGNSSYKMNPPIRSEDDRAYLRQSLENGDIDFVSTDHAPHETAVKGGDFSKAAFGTTGLESSLRVLFTLLQNKELSPTRLVEMFSTNPAKYLGVSDEFGSIAVGQPAKIVICDPWAEAAEFTLADTASLSHNNIFLGHKLAGKILGVVTPQKYWAF